MRQLTHDQCMSLLSNIKSSPPGDWTHDLNTIREGPARLVERLTLPHGHEVVYFRHPDGARSWPAANWDRFAVQRAPQEIEQMTLF
ncbi:hypothetical protein KQJ23_12745 [Paenibacillus sp. MSJ-6]|uniref:Uncharacterized protein n=2 Tax=Paenibacillus brevis TaxID=2841508 RepID=A0ABS6FR81_9BACL|nr:hypothetical protein [Paenibacillus brevis]